MMEDLIPGLPEEIARECLLRVPYDAFRTARSVCKLWKQEVESSPFRHLRKSAGLARPLVVLAQAEPKPSPPATKNHATLALLYRLVLFDPSTAAWAPLPPVPGLHYGLPLFCQLAAVGTELVVIGGWDPRTWAASDEVFVGIWGPSSAFFSSWKASPRSCPSSAFFSSSFSSHGRPKEPGGEASSDSFSPPLPHPPLFGKIGRARGEIRKKKRGK